MTQKQKKHTASVFVILLFAALFMIGIFYVGNVSSQSQIINSGKAQEKAKPANRVKTVNDATWKLKIPRKQLVEESQLIVIGKPVGNLCIPSADGNEVVTEYKFRTEEVIKGAMPAGNIITIRLPGGVVRQADGTVLNVVSAGFRKMKNTSTYLLFLKGNTNQQLSSLRGPQGIFEFANNSAALISYGSFAKENFKPGTNEENLNTNEFLGEIRNLVEKK